MEWARYVSQQDMISIPESIKPIGTIGRSMTSIGDVPKTMNFSINSADGGFVVELRRYDQRKGDDERKLYIVSDEKNLGEELGKIITIESLRH